MKNSKNKLLSGCLLGVLLSTVALPAMAQTSLISRDGSFTLEGELQSVDEENYVIETEFGELIVQREFVTCEGQGCPSSKEDEATNTQIVLSSPDGSFKIEGNLLDTTETDYVIATINGELTVRRELVKCEGAACPLSTDVTVQEQFTIVGPSDVGVDILRTVIGRYSDAKGLDVTTSSAGNGNSDLFVGNTNGVEVARIRVQGQNSASAMQAVVDGSAAFALVRERITPTQLSALTGRAVDNVGDLLIERTIGLDAISFVTNSSNPLDTISVSDIRLIFEGKISNWDQLGGPSGAINLHSLPMESELMAQMTQKLFGSARTTASANYVFHDNMEDLMDAVNADPLGLAAVYRSRQGDRSPLDLASNCNIFYGNTDFAVQSREYPFAVGWYLYAARSTTQTEFGRNLISFLQTDDGQDALSSHGLLGQELRSLPMKEQGNRVLTTVLANDFGQAGDRVISKYLAEVAGSVRLSTSLRFSTGSATPDSKANEDIARISAIVRQPEYENYVVKLVGFSDSVGNFGRNITLSQSRARQIKELLLAKNPGWLNNENVQITGSGPVAPVECNTTDAGRSLNRRVEVWLSPPQR